MGKNRGSKSEPEAMLHLRHTTSSAEGAPIVSLAPMRICRPPFVKGAGAAAPGDFAYRGCHTTPSICFFAPALGAWRFSTPLQFSDFSPNSQLTTNL